MLKGRYVSLSVIACMAVALIAAPAAVQAASAALGLSSTAASPIRDGSVTVDVELTALDPACPADGELGDRVTLAQLFLSYSSECAGVTADVSAAGPLTEVLFQEVAGGKIKLLLAVSDFTPDAKQGACAGDKLATIQLNLPADCCGGSVGVELLAGDPDSAALTTLYTTSNAQILPTVGAAWAGYYDRFVPDLSGLPAGLELEAGANCGAVITEDYCALVTDECVGGFTCEQSPAVGASVGTDVSEVTITVTESGSGVVHTGSVPVTWTDSTDPVISPACGTITVPALNANGTCSVTVPDVKTFLGLSASDNCTTALHWSQIPAAGGTYSNVETPLSVTVSVADDAGNSASCAFSFTFTNLGGGTVSVTPPALPVELAASATAPCQAALGDYRNLVTVSGGCGAITRTQTPAIGTMKSIGTHSVTITASDSFGNSGSAIVTVVVKDKTAPALQCPAGSTIEVSDPCGSYVIPDMTGSVVRTENCSGPTTISQSPPANTVIWLAPDVPQYTQWITFTVRDSVGNMSLCSTTVTIKDTTAPAVAPNAKDSIAAGSGCKGVMPDLFAEGYVTVTGACEAGDEISQSIAPGAELDLGDTDVVFEYCDRYGARGIPGHCAQTTVTVTVEDKTAPTISCPANMGGATNESGLRFDAPAITVGDNCGADVACYLHYGEASQEEVVWDATSGTLFPVGTNTVTCVATDAAGNSSSCSFNVIVTSYKTLNVTVEMQAGFTASTVTRCMKFTLVNDQDCPNQESFTRLMSFTNRVATDVIELGSDVSAKPWTHLVVVDELHALARVLPLTLAGTQYTASFTGAHAMKLGNVNGDGFVDIIDFAQIVDLVTPAGTPASDPNTTCDTPRPHADLSGDGTVTILQAPPAVGDASFVVINFLQKNETVCVAAAPAGSPKARSTVGARSRVTVAELKKMGLSDKADLDRDGDVDTMDLYKLVGGIE